MAGEWSDTPFEKLLSEPVRNGIYKAKEFHGRGAKIVNMGELFAHPRLRSAQMRRVELNTSEKDRFLLVAGDLIFARRSLTAEGAGKCSVVLEVDEPTTFESSIIRARPEKSKADSLYLYYFFNSPSGFHALDTIRRQVAVAGITGSDLAKLEIPTPPIEEQRAIARILGALDDRIELNRRMNQTLEAMARALFKSWFIDFDGVPPDDMQDSELGPIPKGWRAVSLSDALEIIGGGTPKTNVDDYWGGDIPWFSVVDTPTASDVFVVKTEKSITQAGLNGSSARLVPKGTTLISARGTVGNLAVAGRDMTFNQSCYGLRGKNGVGDYFVFLTAQRMVEQLRSMAHGSVFSTITRQTFDAIRIPNPPENLLAEFEQTVSAYFEEILMNVRQSQTLAHLRDSLLPKLISGELRVKDAERIVPVP